VPPLARADRDRLADCEIGHLTRARREPQESVSKPLTAHARRKVVLQRLLLQNHRLERERLHILFVCKCGLGSTHAAKAGTNQVADRAGGLALMLAC